MKCALATEDRTERFSCAVRRRVAEDHSLGIDALDRALAGTGDGACAVSPDGRILVWNRTAERILGYASDEVLGRAYCDVFTGQDDEGNRLCYQQCHVMPFVRDGEAVESFDIRTWSKTLRPVWLNVSVLVIPDGRARAAMTVHLFRDVTATQELLTLVRERRTVDGETAEDPQGPLSRRELEVLRLLATGLNTRAVAERLHVSPATIRNHVQNLFGKIEVHSRLEAVAYATRRHLL
jgi:PAS domain S-box-containing protein